MPAIVTHYAFAQEVYAQLPELVGETPQERQAFLLGSQGPDPLFFINPLLRMFGCRRLGSKMHGGNPIPLFDELHKQMGMLSADEAATRAYCLGFVLHHVLDSTMHPLVFGQQFQICDAGVDGLTRENGSDVHAVIEAELDEYVLSSRLGHTIETFRPVTALRLDDASLLSVSQLYSRLSRKAYGKDVEEGVFALAVKAYRASMVILRSPSGITPKVLGRIERLARPYSHVEAMALRKGFRTGSVFSNDGDSSVPHPFVEECTITASFDELFEEAKARALELLPLFASEHLGEEDLHVLTREVNFSGRPV